MSESQFMVAAFYRFADLPDYEALRGPLLQSCQDLGLFGTILLAAEGINGTVAGPEQGVRRLMQRLRDDARLRDLDFKTSWAAEIPFHRMKVRLKKEIVSLGVEGIDPVHEVGVYVPPEDWNELIAREEQ